MHGPLRIQPCLACAAGRRPAAADPHNGRRRHWFSGELLLISIVIGFGITTLLATGLLFVMQMFEDFGND
jgi:hypothetical protein